MNRYKRNMETGNKLTDKIMVEEPYNVLCGLEQDSEGSVYAEVKNEFLCADEHGPIGSSEAGRHLAILGSIALSISDKSKHYYLAINADIKRKNVTIENAETLKLKARVLSKGKRDGEISGFVLDENDHMMYQAEVKYLILSLPLFAKLFNAHKNTIEIKNEISPYQKRRKLSDISISKNKITGTYGMISPNDCEGHFKDYPALPVAVVGNILGELGIKLFLCNNSDRSIKAAIVRANMNAHKLAFHGEHLTFRAEVIQNKESNTMILFCEALVGDNAIADAEIEVVGIKPIAY